MQKNNIKDLKKFMNLMKQQTKNDKKPLKR